LIRRRIGQFEMIDHRDLVRVAVIVDADGAAPRHDRGPRGAA
jgi:hypothetical protein